VSPLRSAGHPADPCTSFGTWSKTWQSHPGIAGRRPEEVDQDVPAPEQLDQLKKTVLPASNESTRPRLRDSLTPEVLLLTQFAPSPMSQVLDDGSMLGAEQPTRLGQSLL